jgi:hypothetical protein
MWGRPMNYKSTSFILLTLLGINTIHAQQEKPKTFIKKVSDKIRSSTTKERIITGSTIAVGTLILIVGCIIVRHKSPNNHLSHNVFRDAPKCTFFDIFYPDSMISAKPSLQKEGRSYELNKMKQLSSIHITRPDFSDPNIKAKCRDHLVICFYDADSRCIYKHFEPCANQTEAEVIALRDMLVEQAKITLQKK